MASLLPKFQRGALKERFQTFDRPQSNLERHRNPYEYLAKYAPEKRPVAFDPPLYMKPLTLKGKIMGYASLATLILTLVGITWAVKRPKQYSENIVFDERIKIDPELGTSVPVNSKKDSRA